MTELEKEYLHLRNRKDELEDWLQNVNAEVVEIQNKIAMESKIIRIRDFIVTVDPLTSSSWTKTREAPGVMITHKLTGKFEHCSRFEFQHRNKTEAMTNIMHKLKQLGWKDETTN